MSYDISQLIHLLQNGQGQNSQTLAISGTTNQLLSSQGAVSSDGPNASQRFQIANSNINQITYHFHFMGNSNFGTRGIANRDHGAYRRPSSNARRPSMIEAVDEGDINAKLAAVKESTVEIRKSTEGVKESIGKLAETTDKLNEWITELGWSTFKYRLDNEAEVAFGNLIFERCTSLVRLGESIVEFGQSGVEYGESIVRDSNYILMTTHGESLVLDELTSKLEDVATTYGESCTRFKETFTRHAESFSDFETEFDKIAGELDDDDDESKFSELKEFMEAADFDAFGEMTSELTELIETAGTPVEAFTESMITYAKLLGAPDDVIAAFSFEDD